MGCKTNKTRLLISFSGGETSAYMTWWILAYASHLWGEIVIVFANTGQENKETLEFVDMCDRLLFAPFGYRVVWIEAVQIHGERKSATFRVVDFETADRDGKVFEDAIKKYGIPNQKRPSCTRDLKLTPIQAFTKSLGWNKGEYDTAIGIRADEIDRISVDSEKNRIIYPLIKSKRWHGQDTTKPQINTWWASKPFRLKLKGYQGNCRWCWKKSFRKHLTLIGEKPEIYDFPRRMEAEYGLVGAEFNKPDNPVAEGYRRTFFRGNKSTDDLFEMYRNRGNDFVPAEDDAVVYDDELDQAGGCGDSESCEVFSDEYTEDDSYEQLFVPFSDPIWWALVV